MAKRDNSFASDLSSSWIHTPRCACAENHKIWHADWSSRGHAWLVYTIADALTDQLFILLFLCSILEVALALRLIDPVTIALLGFDQTTWAMRLAVN